MKIRVYTAVQIAQINSFFNAGGYVFDFTDETFKQFTKKCIGIEIKSKYGLSKGKSLKAFFDDNSVDYNLKSTLLRNLLEYYEVVIKGERTTEFNYLCRLADYSPVCSPKIESDDAKEVSENDFVKMTFSYDVDSLGLDSSVSEIIKHRVTEVEKCIENDAPLATILLIGSIMEGILLGMAIIYPQQFNQAVSAPKDKDTGKVQTFPNWSLNNYIDVAAEVGLLKQDVKKFSHVVREFRNYIHPYEQMSSRFSPDKHTSLICFQVLKAAISQTGEFRKKQQRSN